MKEDNPKEGVPASRPIRWANNHGKTRWQPATSTERLWRCLSVHGISGWNEWSMTEPSHATRPFLSRWRWIARLRSHIYEHQTNSRTWTERR